MGRLFKGLCVLLLLASLGTEAQERRFGVTTLSANFLREDADFTAELGNQLLLGTPVEIIRDSSYWRQVSSPDPYKAWCVDLSLQEMTGAGLREYIAAPKYICLAPCSWIFSRPSRKSLKIRELTAGDLLLSTGRVRGSFREVQLPSGEKGFVPGKDIRRFSRWAERSCATPENILSTAAQFLGIPYLWGGTSMKGVDCSGFTRMVWFLNGVLLPRNASQQARIGTEVPMDPEADLKERSAALEPGDLIFFGTLGQNGERDRITHVGIYLGNGEFMHASRYVRINSLYPEADNWYDRAGKMVKARRIIGNEGTEGICRILDSPAYFPAD